MTQYQVRRVFHLCRGRSEEAPLFAQRWQLAGTSPSAARSPRDVNLWNLGSCATDAPVGFFGVFRVAETELSVTVTALSGMLRNLPTRTQVRPPIQCRCCLVTKHQANLLLASVLKPSDGSGPATRWQIQRKVHYFGSLKPERC